MYPTGGIQSMFVYATLYQLRIKHPFHFIIHKQNVISYWMLNNLYG